MGDGSPSALLRSSKADRTAAAAGSRGPAGGSELPAVTTGLRSLSAYQTDNRACKHSGAVSGISKTSAHWKCPLAAVHGRWCAGNAMLAQTGIQPRTNWATSAGKHLLGGGDGLAAAAMPPDCVWPLSRDEPLAAFGPWPCCCCWVFCWTCHRSISTCQHKTGLLIQARRELCASRASS